MLSKTLKRQLARILNGFPIAFSTALGSCSSDPTSPNELGQLSLGTHLYAADLHDGVEVLDVSSPERPSLVMSDPHYHPHDLFSDGHYLYLADQDAHFVLLPLELKGGSP